MCTRPRPLLGVWCHGPCTTSCSGRRSPRSLRPKKSTPGCTMRPMPGFDDCARRHILGGDPHRNEGARNSPYAAAAGDTRGRWSCFYEAPLRSNCENCKTLTGTPRFTWLLGNQMDDACVACVELCWMPGLIVLLATSPGSHHWLSDRSSQAASKIANLLDSVIMCSWLSHDPGGVMEEGGMAVPWGLLCIW